MVDPGRSQRAVYLSTWSYRMRQYAPRLLRLFTLVMVVVIFAPVQAAGRPNSDLDWSNFTPLGGYQFGDFDGDGTTDLFRVTGSQWQFSSAGTGPWTDLASDPANQNELRFGDFDGDGVTDVFHVTGNQWRYSPGGAGSWINLASDTTPFTNLRFGDFDGDLKTDVFIVAPGGQWRFSSAGSGSFQNLAMDPAYTVNDLLFGYLDGDTKIDVFSIDGAGNWRFSSGGALSWDDSLAGDVSLTVNDLVLADFDGDGITDVFNRVTPDPNGQWRYSKSGVQGWAPLAGDPLPLSDLRFGDFNGDSKTDVFSLGPGSQPRYSSGAVDGWQNITPAATPTPMPPGPAVTDIASLAFGDFDADGFTDVFRSNGGQWQFSSRGLGDWQNLAFDPTPLSDLRFGDFNGDGRTDVFSVSGGQWRWSNGGSSNWQNLALDTLTINDLRFGDFNNDGITDVFSVDTSVNPFQWRYRSGGLGAWINLATDPTPLSELAFGDFDGDGFTDVFSIDPVDMRGRYSPQSNQSWVDLDVQNIPLNLLRFADFNGDGRTDIFTRTDSGQWRYLSAGLLPWIDVATDPLSINDLRFGDFNGDNRDDVFSIGPDGRWRYSSAAESNWILLGPPATQTPTFTPTPTGSTTPTPTFTPTPTGSTTPSPTPEGCHDILVNGDFETNEAWIFGDSPVPGKYTGAQHQNGVRSVQLGIPPELSMMESYSSIRQLVNIPANTSTVTLRFWRWGFSDEGANPNPGNYQDRFDVIALSPGGDPLRIVQRTRPVDGGWVQVMLDMSEFSNYSFYLYFNLFNDGHGGRSWIFLDNMMLEVCPGPPVTPGTDMGGHYDCRLEADYHEEEYGYEEHEEYEEYSNQGPRNGGPYGNPNGGYRPPRPICTATPTPTLTPTITPSPTMTQTTPAADLWLTKSVTPTSAISGTTIVYTLVTTNLGPGTAMSVTVSDTLPSGLTYLSNSGNYNNVTGIWTIGTLTNGASATLQITATVAVTTSGTITNFAQVASSSVPDPNPLNNSDSAELLINRADLSLIKLIDPVLPTLEDVPVFTLVITNSGPAIATGVTVSDTIPRTSGFEYVSHSGDGAYDPITGIWTVGSLSPGMTATLVITASFVAEDFDEYTNSAEVWTSDVLDVDSTPGNNSTTEDDDSAIVVTGPLGGEITLVPAGAVAPPVALAADCVEVINNGNFEGDPAAWDFQEGPAAPTFTTEQTFNGSPQAIRLGLVGGDNLASISSVSQMVALPADANSIVLSFRYFPQYEDQPGPGDLQYVDIYNVQTGQFAGRALGTQSNDRTWLTSDYDLTMQAGQNIRLVMAVNNDGVEGRSAMYIDNVSIMACNFGNLVAPGAAPTVDPALGASNIQVAEQAPILLAGRESTQSPTWLARLSALGVLASVIGVIAFAVMVVLGTLRSQT